LAADPSHGVCVFFGEEAEKAAPMSKEIEEMRAHKKAGKDLDVYIDALAADLKKRGYMFIIVVANKDGLHLQTLMDAPFCALNRLAACAVDSAVRTTVSELARVQKKLEAHEPGETWKE
jgi:hypothetical protein